MLGRSGTRKVETSKAARFAQALQEVNAPNKIVENAVFEANKSSRVRVHSIVGSGITFLSCDEKDTYINPWNLSTALDMIETPNLSSLTPVTVNYSADGFPRIEGKPWNGGSRSTGSETAPAYDPSNPATLVSFGLVVNKDTGKLPLSVLGFRVKCRIYDCELGTSTVGIRVFAKDFDHEVLNALISVNSNDAELVIPYFQDNVVRTTVGAGEWTKRANSTIRFFANSGVRDGSYNLVFARPKDTDGEATIADLPSFFTLTGQNVYCYVSPILATDTSVSALLSTLRQRPAQYLETLKGL